MLQVYNPNPKQLEEVLSQGQPVKIHGVLDRWAALKNWTPEYFAKNHGHHQVDIDVMDKGKGPEQGITKGLITPLHYYITLARHLEKNPDPNISLYLHENQNILYQMGLAETIQNYFFRDCAPGICKMAPDWMVLTWYVLWIGCQGSKTGLHFDTDHRNFLCQLYGKKKLWLAPPKMTSYMYPSTKFDRELRGSTSQVNIFNPDFQRFPLFKQAKFETVELNPGDMLYVPSDWWHAAENLSLTVSISCRYETPLTKIKQLPIEAFNLLHDLGLHLFHNCTCHDD